MRLALLAVSFWPHSFVSAGFMDGFKNAFNAVKDAVGDKDVEIRVESHSWSRSIDIQILESKEQEAWCSDLPASSYQLISVAQKERIANRTSQRKPAFEPTKRYSRAEFMDKFAPEKRRAEDGNAYTFQEFKDYYGRAAELKWIEAEVAPDSVLQQKAEEDWQKARPVHCEGKCCPNCYVDTRLDFYCRYLLDTWVLKDLKEAKGADAYPYWPVVDLQECEKPVLGCRRKGDSRAWFLVDVTMKEKGADSWEKSSKTKCSNGNMEMADWQALKVGNVYPAKKRLAYGLLCSSIVSPPRPKLERRIANDGKAYTYEEFAEFYREGVASRWSTAQVAKNEEL